MFDDLFFYENVAEFFVDCSFPGHMTDLNKVDVQTENVHCFI